MFKVLPKANIEFTAFPQSQEEMEKTFNPQDLANEMMLRIDNKMNDLDETLLLLEAKHPNKDIIELVSQFIALLMDPRIGENDLRSGMYAKYASESDFKSAFQEVRTRYPDNTPPMLLSKETFRVASIKDLAVVLTSLPWFDKHYETFADKLVEAYNFLVYMEDKFLYIIKIRNRQTKEQKEYYQELEQSGNIDALNEYLDFLNSDLNHHLYVVFDMKQDEFESLDAHLDITHFPLIDKPLNWKEDSIGGYYSDIRKKPTKQRGSSVEPQNVLDSLNHLQSQEFRLTPLMSPQDYRNYVNDKLGDKDYDNEQEAEEQNMKILNNTTSSFEYVTGIMSGYSFFFEWQFDFRGRAYSTGYNINLQGDKYKKGMLRPMPSNFPQEDYTIDISTIKGI